MPNSGDVPIFVGPEWSSGATVPKGFAAIIYKPGAASAGDHVATWAEVQTFIASADGKCIVYVDDSVVSPALVPGATGITPCLGRVELRPYIIGTTAVTVLQIESGATLQDLYAVTGMELRCDSTVVNDNLLTWTISAGGGYLYLSQGGTLSNSAASTQPAFGVPAGQSLRIEMNLGSVILNNPAQPLISLPGTSRVALEAFDLSTIADSLVSGSGTVDYIFDNATASNFSNPGAVPLLPAPGFSGTYRTTNVDNIAQVTTFNASVVNAFSEFVGLGNVWMTVSGFGGGGGAGGGAGGDSALPDIPGPGGGGGGASIAQSQTILVNMNHRIDVVIGAAGASGAGGAVAGSGHAGGNGGTTYLIDQTAVPPTVLAAFSGATGGTGAINLLGSHVAGLAGASFLGGGGFAQTLSTNTGFVAAGGPGSLTGVSAVPGNNNVDAIGTTAAAPLWAGGAAGGSAVNAGGGGGGGGAGVGGNGGAGATGIVGNGAAGTSAGANTGAGGGGGAGGNAGGTGGAGGGGGSGQMTTAFLP